MTGNRFFPGGFPAAEVPPTGSWRHALLLAFGLFAILVTLYWPAVDFRLLPFDDDQFVRNPLVTGGLDPANIGRVFTTIPKQDLFIPVTLFSFMADVSLFGVSSRGFHLTNLLLHAFSMGLLLLVFWRMTGSLWRSALAAALVGLHPLRVESVAWVAERKDVLSVFFLVLAMASHLRYARSGRFSWFAATFSCAAAGMLSKPILVTLPALLLLLDFWPLGRFRELSAGEGGGGRRVLNLLLEKVPFALCSLLLASHTMTFARAGLRADVTFLSRVEHGLASVFVYLEQTFRPSALSFQFFETSWAHYSGTLLPVAAAVLGTTLIVFRLAGRYPWLAMGWLWYLAALFPVSGIVPSGVQWLSDRFTYVPHVGLMVALVWMAGEFPVRRLRTTLLLLLAFSTVPLAFLARQQLSFWKDGVALLGRGIVYCPEDMDYSGRYVEQLLAAGKVPEARTELERHRGLMMDPKFGVDLQDRYLTVLERSGGRAQAIAEARGFLSRDGRFFRTRLHLADLLVEERRYAEALPEYLEVLAVPVLRPVDRAYALEGTGISLAGLGREPEALDRFREGLAADPGRSRLHYHLGALLARRGSVAEARLHFSEALRIEPENPLVRFGLVELLMAAGEQAAGGALLRDTAGLFPGAAEGLYAQGRLQEAQGERTAAIASYEAALRAPAQWPEVLDLVRKRFGRPATP